jgi:uncharacterized protein with FMN-binding domain
MLKKQNLLLTVLLLFLFLVSQSFAGKYKPGTYKGSAYGKKHKEHSGLIEVEVTVDANSIKNIKVLKYEQSVEHKKYGKSVTEVKDKFPAAITKKQSVDVDVVSGATFSSVALELAVARALAKASTKTYKPGTYKGSAMGKKHKDHSGLIEVEVTVDAKSIKDIKITKYDQSVDHKKYGKSVTEAKNKIPAEIKTKQSVDVDGVTKATMSSNAIQLAVAKALEKAAK